MHLGDWTLQWDVGNIGAAFVKVYLLLLLTLQRRDTERAVTVHLRLGEFTVPVSAVVCALSGSDLSHVLLSPEQC